MTSFEVLLLVLLVVSNALHFIAPLTKTKVDDVAVQVVDAVKDAVNKKKGA